MASHPVDSYVGSRLRARRMILGISQESLGELVGVTFQQIQKYERGYNRIGSSRLYEFSKILNVPVSFFFEDIPDNSNASSKPDAYDAVTDDPDNKETLALVRAFKSIKDPMVKRRFIALLRAVSNTEDDGEHAAIATRETEAV